MMRSLNKGELVANVINCWLIWGYVDQCMSCQTQNNNENLPYVYSMELIHIQSIYQELWRAPELLGHNVTPRSLVNVLDNVAVYTFHLVLSISIFSWPYPLR